MICFKLAKDSGKGGRRSSIGDEVLVKVTEDKQGR